MSYLQNLETKGKRLLNHEWSTQVSCPTSYKYLSCIGVYLTNHHLTGLAAGSNYQSGGVDDAGIHMDDTPGTDFHILDSSGTVTSSTPFVIHKAKYSWWLKNNVSVPANCTLYHLRIRSVLAINDQDTEDSSTICTNQVMRLITEGIADKISSVQTELGVVNCHTTGAGGVPTYCWSTETGWYEASVKANFTIFDSHPFCEKVKVVDVKQFRLKPGDTCEIHKNLPGQAFLDGIEPYVHTSNEVCGYDFTDLFFIQLEGDVAHASGAVAQGLPNANGALNRQYIKQTVAEVSTDYARVDVYHLNQLEVEVFNGSLIDPYTGNNILTTANFNDMADTLVQVVADVE